MTANPPVVHFAPRYYSRFACIGSACEEHCCQGWTISVDARHYKKLKVIMDGSPREREQFRQAHQRNRDEKAGPDSYATIRPRADGACSLLDKKGLCSVHGKYGEEYLSDTCATYPRVMSRVGPRVEMSGSPSCPEMARQLLLADDAMELDRLPDAVVNGLRPYPTQATPGGLSDDPYERYLDDVRAAMFYVMAQPHTLAERLWLVARFAQRVQPFFHAGTKRFEELPLAVAMSQLEDTALTAQALGLLSELQRQPGMIDKAGRVGMGLALGMMRARIETLPAGRLRQLGIDALDSYRAEGAAVRQGQGADESLSLDADAMWRAYRARRDRVSAEGQARIDQLLSNYARNLWMRHFYVRSPSLEIYVQRQILSLALVRFLVYSHPRLAADLDGTVVEVVWAFARAVEHSNGFLEYLELLLKNEGLASLAAAVCLLMI